MTKFSTSHTNAISASHDKKIAFYLIILSFIFVKKIKA
ncbi:hypothetical protein NU08_1832 [Flavobacterium anhuiense]|uniref:Uncharacterized protein n=1 Tax=Flavobacterium anhuiense TaxID=459526 RepID=A0A444VZN8_9FLAO|nr:hypothetical protein NU08_1832 [Flavobacterium anhuiense]